MSDRIVAEFHDPKLTGIGAIDRYAEQEGREVDVEASDGTFSFVDGVKTYRPVMIPNGSGWRIIVVREA